MSNSAPIPRFDQPRRSLSRRGLLGLGGAAVVATTSLSWTSTAAARPLPRDPFTLGVASGEPTFDGVVLWTRLAVDPTALDGRGGMSTRPIEVQWEIARDPSFGKIEQRGRIFARAAQALSVHVELRRTRAEPRVLVPLPSRAIREHDRPHQDRAASRTAQPGDDLCVRVLSEPSGPLLQPVRASSSRAARPRSRTSATTSTREPGRRCCPAGRTCRRRRSSAWPTTGSAMRSTRPIRCCRRRTPAHPGSPVG